MLFHVFESTSSPERRSLNRVLDAYSVIAAVLQQVFDLAGLIRQAQYDFVNARTPHQIDLIEEERSIRDRNNWFRGVESQRTQTRSFASSQYESLHACDIHLLYTKKAARYSVLLY